MTKLVVLAASLLIAATAVLSPVNAQQTPQASPPAQAVYKLPSPGILPDHPLYKLKVLRDKIVLLLIADPDKKARYHLTLANKQLLMSKLLIEKGNIALAKQTALKGENQMTLMTFVFKNASRTPGPAFLEEVKQATAKHQEILREIIEKVPAEDAETFSIVLEFSQRNLNQMQYLSSSKE